MHTSLTARSDGARRLLLGTPRATSCPTGREAGSPFPRSAHGSPPMRFLFIGFSSWLARRSPGGAISQVCAARSLRARNPQLREIDAKLAIRPGRTGPAFLLGLLLFAVSASGLPPTAGGRSSSWLLHKAVCKNLGCARCDGR
jgi:hypothetical protein